MKKQKTEKRKKKGGVNKSTTCQFYRGWWGEADSSWRQVINVHAGDGCGRSGVPMMMIIVPLRKK